MPLWFCSRFYLGLSKGFIFSYDFAALRVFLRCINLGSGIVAGEGFRQEEAQSAEPPAGQA